MFEGLYFSKFSFHLEARDTIILPPYKGSTFRGGFGHAFKRIVCSARRRSCDECLLRKRCIYIYVFDTPPPEGSEVLRKYTNVPHPFVIEPPLDPGRIYAPGEPLVFSLVLVGRATEYLPYFIYTFEELGDIGIGKGRGRYRLTKVVQNGCGGETAVYSASEKALSADRRTLTPADLPTDHGENTTLTLRFLTPARIISRGSLVVDLEFHHLVRSLLRRVSSLTYFHCSSRLELDFRGMIESAAAVTTVERRLRWYDWERYSARQATRMKMGGVVGAVRFRGKLHDFMPLVRIGEFLHVGKGTSFGLGRYMVENGG